MQPHMAVVPYQGHGASRAGCRCWPGECCTTHYSGHCAQQVLPTPSLPQVAIPNNIEDRLRALEGDKDQLHIQVTVLSDQVENQTDKITDLERVLDDKQGVLQKTEDVLARELLEKSALETARLGLLSEITDMRLRQTATERENQELRRRLQKSLHLSDASLERWESAGPPYSPAAARGRCRQGCSAPAGLRRPGRPRPPGAPGLM